MKSSIRFVVIFALLGNAHPQSAVSFCDLLRHPEQYNGKEVTVRATYRYGFEWKELYCIDCKDKGKVWLELPYPDRDDAVGPLKRAPKGAGIVNITVSGVFVSGGHFGHQNSYPYKFIVKRVGDIAVIQKGMKSIEVEERAEKRWGCGGTNPK